jgi:hypothetical protein
MSLDLARFDPEAPDLDLIVGASAKFDVAVRQEAAAIAGPVKPPVLRPRPLSPDEAPDLVFLQPVAARHDVRQAVNLDAARPALAEQSHEREPIAFDVAPRPDLIFRERVGDRIGDLAVIPPDDR